MALFSAGDIRLAFLREPEGALYLLHCAIVPGEPRAVYIFLDPLLREAGRWVRLKDGTLSGQQDGYAITTSDAAFTSNRRTIQQALGDVRTQLTRLAGP